MIKPKISSINAIGIIWVCWLLTWFKSYKLLILFFLQEDMLEKNAMILWLLKYVQSLGMKRQKKILVSAALKKESHIKIATMIVINKTLDIAESNIKIHIANKWII